MFDNTVAHLFEGAFLHVYDLFIKIYRLQNGWSPLLVASEHGHLDILKILLQHHARVDVFDEVSEF